MLNRIVLSDMDKPCQPRLSSQDLEAQVQEWLDKGNSITELEPAYCNPRLYTSANGARVELVETTELKAAIKEYGALRLAKKLKISKDSVMRILKQPTVKKETYDKYMGAMK